MEDSYRKNQAYAALEDARRLVREAKEQLENKYLTSSEKIFRRSLAKIREATLWEPEDSDHHKYLHKIGRLVHDTFECKLELNDGSYWVTCPVILSHSNLGFSVGGSTKVICSICGDEYLVCPHVKGEIYDKVVACRHKNLCNICGKSECEHEEGRIYNGAKAFGILTDLDVDHVALVNNPANPLAVVFRYSVSKSELLTSLPEDERDLFVYGKTDVYCHHCIDCDGT